MSKFKLPTKPKAAKPENDDRKAQLLHQIGEKLTVEQLEALVKLGEKNPALLTLLK